MYLRKGFSLIELLVVIIIISIFAAFAYPSYMEYVKRTKREEVKSEMMRIAQQLQSYRIINHSYAGATLSTVDSTGSYPVNGTMYSLVLTVPVADTQIWELKATPVSTQVGNGHLLLNSQGYKCWEKGSDKNGGIACVPSATSNWDGR